MAPTAQTRVCFIHLESVADRPPQGLLHAAQNGRGADMVIASNPDHHVGQLPRPVGIFHEGSASHFHVQHQIGRSGRDFLRHDGRRDEREAVYGLGHVAKGIENAIRGSQSTALGYYCQPHGIQLAAEVLLIEMNAETRNAFQLVKRPTRVTQSSA